MNRLRRYAFGGLLRQKRLERTKHLGNFADDAPEVPINLLPVHRRHSTPGIKGYGQSIAKVHLHFLLGVGLEGGDPREYCAIFGLGMDRSPEYIKLPFNLDVARPGSVHFDALVSDRSEMKSPMPVQARKLVESPEVGVCPNVAFIERLQLLDNCTCVIRRECPGEPDTPQIEEQEFPRYERR